MDLTPIINKHILLVTGKGGVGRTIISAAIAMAAARAGKRVLLTEIADSQDARSPLAQFFGKKYFTRKPKSVATNLKGCHLWAPYGHELFLRSAIPGGTLIGAAIRSKTLQSFLQTAPSFLEMGWYYHLMTLLKAPHKRGGYEHELIIVDMPATGHTLALTGLPELLLKLIKKGPMVTALQEGQAFMNSPESAAAVVVTLPEQLPVSEALELIDGLHETSVPVGCVVLNRFPADPFTPEEHVLLEAELNGKNMFGALNFYRILRSQEAMERLTKESKYPIFQIAEMELEGPRLPVAISDEIQSKYLQGT